MEGSEGRRISKYLGSGTRFSDFYFFLRVIKGYICTEATLGYYYKVIKIKYSWTGPIEVFLRLSGP